MPRRELKVSPEIPHAVVEGLELLRSRLEVPISFPGDVLAEAEHLRKDPPGFPRHADRTVVELVTVDPASSKDLDQAVRIERRGIPGLLCHCGCRGMGETGIFPGG